MTNSIDPKPGETWLCRGGSVAVIVWVIKSAWPIEGTIDGERHEWRAKGKWGASKHPLDLISRITSAPEHPTAKNDLSAMLDTIDAQAADIARLRGMYDDMCATCEVNAKLASDRAAELAAKDAEIARLRDAARGYLRATEPFNPILSGRGENPEWDARFALVTALEETSNG